MKDKEFIKKLVNTCSDILLAGHKVSYGKAKGNVYRKPFETLAGLLEERFNIRYAIINGGLLATVPPISSVGSAITDLNYKKYIQEWDWEDGAEMIKNNDKVFTIDLGFYIDYKNKEIIYKGKNKFEAEVYISPKELSEIGLTPQEFAAALLHEIGHDFEFLRYTIYKTHKAENVIDKIRKVTQSDNVLDKLIEITVEENGSKYNIEEMSTPQKITLLMEFPATLFDPDEEEYMIRRKLGNKIVQDKEFEQLADEFTAHFSMSHFLPSGLNKINMFFNTLSSTGVVLYAKLIYNTIDTEMLKGWDEGLKMIMHMFLLDVFVQVVWVPLYSILYKRLGDNTKKVMNKLLNGLTNLWMAYDSLIMIRNFLNGDKFMLNFTLLNTAVSAGVNYYQNYRESDSTSIFSYENDLDRYSSIKQSIIEKLKNEKNLELRKLYLEQIKNVDKAIKDARLMLSKLSIINLLPSDSPYSPALRDGNNFNPIYLMTQIVRSHINNDLYVSAATLDINNKS